MLVHRKKDSDDMNKNVNLFKRKPDNTCLVNKFNFSAASVFH